jgi:hypothetical protein
MSNASVQRPIMTLPSDQDSSGRDLGVEELELLKQAINSGTLTSTKGSFTRTLESASPRPWASRVSMPALPARRQSTWR